MLPLVGQYASNLPVSLKLWQGERQGVRQETEQALKISWLGVVPLRRVLSF
jgi:hypothetical protein